MSFRWRAAGQRGRKQARPSSPSARAHVLNFIGDKQRRQFFNLKSLGSTSTAIASPSIFALTSFASVVGLKVTKTFSGSFRGPHEILPEGRVYAVNSTRCNTAARIRYGRSAAWMLK